MLATACQRMLVSGRVQGVGFRYFVLEQARLLGLRGHALNLADGSVEVLACGEPAALAELRQRLRSGPPRARVQALRVQDLEQADCPPGFRVG